MRSSLRFGALLRAFFLPLTFHQSLITIAVLFSVLCPLTSVHAQGSLTPPGTPTPTMKTLDEVEPRINIQRTINPLPNDANYHYIISQPGSYYLSANLDVTKSNGIHVTAPGVVIDLNGFQMARGSGTGGEGITIDNTAHRCTIKHGSINGFSIGVRCTGSGGNFARGGSFSQLTIANCTSEAMFAGQGWQVDGCEAHANPSFGIVTSFGCTLTKCTASGNGFAGISAAFGCTLSDCTASDNNGVGIHAGIGSTLNNCTAYSNHANQGISADSGSTLTHCAAYSNQDAGISAGLGSVLTDCNASENQGVGFFVVDSSSLTHCTAYHNHGIYGMQIGNSCVVTNCSVGSNANDGIVVGTASVVTGCSAVENGFSGILASDGSTISKCSARGNSGNGLVIGNACNVEGNTTQANAVASTAGTPYSGILVNGSGNRIEANHVIYNSAASVAGLRVVTVNGNNLVVRNSAIGNTTNYSIAAGNKDAQIISPGSGFVSTDPWANFSFP